MESAVSTWVKQLIDLGGRNRLLYYRDLKVGTLDLTPLAAASSERFDDLLAGNVVMLSQLVPPSQLELLDEDSAQSEAVQPSPSDIERYLRRARALVAKRKENYEERGLETLQIGWGLATWASERTEAAPSAPVALAVLKVEPVGAAGRDYALRLDGPWTLNGALSHVLELDYQVRLPQRELDAELERLAESRDATRLFERIQSACVEVPGFDISRRMVLANFSYAKLPIAADLQASIPSLVDHDVVAALAGDEEAKRRVREQSARSSDCPAELPPEDEFLVLDADSSQSMAINAVTAGAHTVIEGPPGTGKSQTIANLIATLVAHGRRVLFVAEKRAAIDAVTRRLEQVGLSDLVLDLHDGTSERKRIAEGLAEAMAHASRTPLDDVSDKQRRLADRRAELDCYAQAIREPRLPWGVSYFAAESEALGTPGHLRSSRRLRGPDLAALSLERLGECAETLREYVSKGGCRLAASGSPWAEALYQGSVSTPSEAEQVFLLLERLRLTDLPQARDAVAEVEARLGCVRPTTLSAWSRVPGAVDALTLVQQRFTDDIFAVDIPELVAALQPGRRGGLGGVVVRLSDSQFRAARKQAKSLCLQRADGLETLVAWLNEANDSLTTWRDLLPDAQPDRRYQPMGEMVAILARVQSDADALVPTTGLDLMGLSVGDAGHAVERLWESVDWLYRLPTLVRDRRGLIEQRLGQFLEDLEHGGVEVSGDAVRTLRFVWLSSIVEAVRIADPTLAAFDGAAQSDLVSEFRRLDAEHIALTAARVRRACAEALIRARDRYPEESELVARQAMRKRGHLPMRDFLPKAEHVLMALKPCWAMSPLVVSQVLPNKSLFDTVVFDEASQVPPWDAVSSVLRGKTVVVAGDRKQLPPTTFFLAADDGALEEEIDDDSRLMTQDLESVLDVMLNVLPSTGGTRTLKWHYRSRDERLIAFSNAAFYSHDLTTFPGVEVEPCVRHHVVGASSLSACDEASPSAEVLRVVELIFEHARLRPHESLGVIAMGIKHADRIGEAVRLRSLQEPDCDAFFIDHHEEPFFVKNLERVQGDERDAIILSIGYGRTADGRMRYVFGPLNNEGGERRLNVAVTRAKRRCDVVSTFGAGDMDPARLKAEGARMLRAYLEYAESGGRSLPGYVAERPALNPFERDVGERLAEAGIPVIPQYGASGYFIDFAAQHPALPGRMVLAIECDGEKYHRSQSARDRDRLRQEHLERLGWRFVRIWSSDWARDPERQVERVKQDYRRAVESEDHEDDCHGTDEHNSDAPEPPSGLAAVPLPSCTSRRGDRPFLPAGLPIDEYSKGQLMAVLRWIQSDTLLRTRDEMLAELMAELGFKRRGKKIVTACNSAIDGFLASDDPDRLRRAREAGIDALGSQGVSVRFDTTVGWRYRVDDREVGPMTWHELWAAARRGDVSATTPVHHRAFGDWRPASEIPRLCE